MTAAISFLSGEQRAARIQSHGSERMKVHDHAMVLASNYRRCEAELFQIISMIDEKQIYLDLMIPSLFQYCVEMLKLSRQISYDFICVIRRSREVPNLREAILSGRSSLSKLRKVCTVITPENAAEWISLTIECSSRVVEKAVALANPRSPIQEKMKYVSGDTLQFQLAVSEEWAELLANVKDLMSQKQMRNVESEEALFLLMSTYKQKHDPVNKAGRAASRKATSRTSSTATPTTLSNPAASSVPRTRYISAETKHTVHLRDLNQCTFTSEHGERCLQKRYLQIHHLVHFSDGGKQTPENLRTLCWAHHRAEHLKEARDHVCHVTG